jgi:hypothetical protein
MIVDYLHDNRISLEACSLASRSLLPASQLHLFRHVGLHSPERQDEFLEMLNGNSRIVPFIRSLGVGYRVYGIERHGEGNLRWKKMAEICSRMASTGKISSLVLHQLQLLDIDDEVGKAVLGGLTPLFDTVKDLTIQWGSLSSHDLSTLATAFASCRHLKVVSTYINEFAKRRLQVEAFPKGPPLIESLAITSMTYFPPHMLVGLLLDAVNVHQLKHLGLLFCPEADLTKDVLLRVGASLESLTVGYDQFTETKTQALGEG